ncbi:MAG: choice-of-anchor H family protein [Granulosicoccaceae bacterium]
MTTTNTNSRVLKTLPFKRLLSTLWQPSLWQPLLFCALQLPVIAVADTQVRLQTVSNELRITEGYSASVEEWAAVKSEQETQGHVVYLNNSNHHSDVWVDDVGTSLFADNDHDGYFGGFSLSFDVDTSYGSQDIYATVFLQLGNQSPVVLLTSKIFTIYGRSGSDIYRVEAQLIDQYPAGDYQVRIDIHDAHNGQVLDSVDDQSFRNLRNLPLEAEPYHDGVTSAAIITEFAGFGGPLLLLILGFSVLLRRAGGGNGILTGIPNAAPTRPVKKKHEPL